MIGHIKAMLHSHATWADIVDDLRVVKHCAQDMMCSRALFCALADLRVNKYDNNALLSFAF